MPSALHLVGVPSVDTTNFLRGDVTTSPLVDDSIGLGNIIRKFKEIRAVTFNGRVDLASNGPLIEDIAGNMFAFNAEAGLSLIFNAGTRKIDANLKDFAITVDGAMFGDVIINNAVSSNLALALSVEGTQDIAGAMFSGNNENQIALVYNDVTGKIDATLQPNSPVITLAGDTTGSATIVTMTDTTITTVIPPASISKTQLDSITAGNGRGVRNISFDTPIISGIDDDLYYQVEVVSPSIFTQIDSMHLNGIDGVSSQHLVKLMTASNRKKWIYSTWLQRTTLGLGTFEAFFSGGNSATAITGTMRFDNQDRLEFRTGGGSFNYQSKALFRDPTAWYHIVVSYDSANVIQDERMLIYINGEKLVDFDSGLIKMPLNFESEINSAINHRVGSLVSGAPVQSFGGYIAQATFIDGQNFQVDNFTIDDFGQLVTAGTNGRIWTAKDNNDLIAFANAGGVNSFCLIDGIADGIDESTKGNDFAPQGTLSTINNASKNSPTNKHMIWNSIDKGTSVVLTRGNLQITNSSVGLAQGVRGTFAVPAGKYYYEIEIIVKPPTTTRVMHSGWVDNNFNLQSSSGVAVTPGGGEGVNWNVSDFNIRDNSGLPLNGSATFSNATPTVGDIIMYAYDSITGDMWFGLNGIWDSGDPALGTLPSIVGVLGERYPAISTRNTNTGSNPVGEANFGQRPYAFPLPTGFVSLNSANFPTPIFQGGDFFNTVAYTGNGSTQNITNVGLQPDFTWIKSRTNGGDGHALYDEIRGVNTILLSNTTQGQITIPGMLTSFNSDGFSLGNNLTVNRNAANYVAWNWKAGTPGLNNSGTIQSTVSAAEPGHFSIVTYTGNGAGSATIAHSLGKVPGMIIVKQLTSSTQWRIWHEDLDPNFGLIFATSAASSGGSRIGSNHTASTFEVINTGGDGVNANGLPYVAYVFADVPGVCKIGSYRGNNSATSGPFIHCGFKPAFVMIKSTGLGQWVMVDNERADINDNFSRTLLANLPNSEDTAANGNNSGQFGDFLSEGFKIRSTLNSTNEIIDHIFIAFGEVAGNGFLPPIPASIGGKTKRINAKSISFNNTGKLEFTPGSTNSNRKWTFSWWQKLDADITSGFIWEAKTATSERANISWGGGINRLSYTQERPTGFISGNCSWFPTVVLGVWQHYVFHYDADNPIVNQRQRMFLNGVDLGPALLGPAVAPGSGTINNEGPSYINQSNVKQESTLDTIFLNAFPGLWADVYLTDGSIQPPTAFADGFGPIPYTGPIGAGGWHLDFTDQFNIGNDSSINNNNHTIVGTIVSNGDGPP